MKFSNLKDLRNGIVEVEAHLVFEDETPEQKQEEGEKNVNNKNVLF